MSDLENELEFDVRRSLVLSEYIAVWGMPEYRVTLCSGHDKVELYSFPGDFNRFATVGISMNAGDDRRGSEILFVFPSYLTPSAFGEVIGLFEASIPYFYENRAHITVGHTLDVQDAMPADWPTCCLLLDQAAGEPEGLAEIRVGSGVVELLWAYPIHRDEYDFIRANGIDEFNKLSEDSDWNPANPLRPSYLQQ